MRAAIAAVLASLALGCSNNLLAYIDGALLPDADQSMPADDGPTLVVKAETVDATLAVPKGPVVRLAIDRAVPWLRVEALIHRVEAAGARPVLLVGQRQHVRAFQLHDPLGAGESIVVRVDDGGQHCVSKTGVLEMRCTKGAGKHIHRAFVREDVREAVKEYGLAQVQVRVNPLAEWADVVRVVDGARTCCGTTKVLAAIAPPGPDPDLVPQDEESTTP
jgi:hypothetical protein